MTRVFIKIILFFNLSMVAFAFLTGNKTIANQEIYITADQITSDDESGIIDAFGNVILIDDDGNKVYFDLDCGSIEYSTGVIAFKDFYPITELEKVFAMASMLVACGVFAYVVGSIETIVRR